MTPRADDPVSETQYCVSGRTGYSAFAVIDGGYRQLGDDNTRYNAASTAFAISAVPLLPPNSIGLMPSA